jgi:hypothetical protein
VLNVCAPEFFLSSDTLSGECCRMPVVMCVVLVCAPAPAQDTVVGFFLVGGAVGDDEVWVGFVEPVGSGE